MADDEQMSHEKFRAELDRVMQSLKLVHRYGNSDKSLPWLDQAMEDLRILRNFAKIDADARAMDARVKGIPTTRQLR